MIMLVTFIYSRYTLLYHPRFLSDTSRVARRMLINGKRVEAGENSDNAMDDMERVSVIEKVHGQESSIMSYTC